MSLETAQTSVSTPSPNTSTGPLPPLPDGWESLAKAFLKRVQAHRGKSALSDSTGASLSYGETLVRALALGRVLARTLGPEPYVGLLLPPSVPTAVANLALTLWGKIPVNLNYTASKTVVDSAIDQCGIAQVITSQKVLDRFQMTPKGALVFLEDVPKQVRLTDKLWAASVARLVPTSWKKVFLPGLRGTRLDETATVIFTSGSTGDPKGVVLSHRNILSNIHQMNSHLRLLEDESVLGILPFFHSFGFTVTIWTVLCLGKRVVYHVSPLDARIIGGLCEKHGVTLLVGTPTYMRMYLQKCAPEQFKTLYHLLLGAEKLKPELAKEIREGLGIDPLEGYGCTELSPVVAVNVPYDKVLVGGRTVPGNRLGTVGMPLPGTEIKVTDPESGDDLPRGSVGMIRVKGPQVMVGYLNRPDATAKVIQDGWYTTGDLGFVDDDGFLSITDRLSRFAKIGGEMVPHHGVEAAVVEAAGVSDANVAVTSIPDPKRGERLVVLYTDLGASVDEVYRKLQGAGLPKLWIPAQDDFIAIESIPILGTGKVDLRRLREIALERRGR
jgi:acyl-[acyl-carrier-protein]-phospholipid O-acyltransferase/long-chain-fatty-acid--[acyl-carrier-protein] ligase